MIRKRLAALILTAGLSFLSGCTSSNSFGSGSGGGLFSHCHNRNGCSASAASASGFSGFCAPGCPCEIPGGCDGCDSGLVPDLAAMPSAAVPTIPPAGPPTSPPPGMPQFGSPEPPLGGGTKYFTPVPQQAKTYPYMPIGY